MAKKAPGIRATLHGSKEFNKAMKDLPQKIRGRIMRDAFKKAAKPVVKAMKENVPTRLESKGRDPRPGDPTLKEVKKSIGSKIKTYKESGITVAIIGPRAGEKFRSRITNARLTTISVGIERGWKGRQPVPFVRDTRRSESASFKQRLAAEVGPATEKEAARIYRKAGSGKKLSTSELAVFGKI
jgi:hypothetical protein